jgi:type I restriction enzyme S subunit
MTALHAYNRRRHRFLTPRRPRNHNLEEQARALYKSWFVDFEPFEKDTDGIPIGWKQVSLSDIMGYSGGSQPPASEFISEPLPGYIRFIQIRDYESDSHITYIPISKRNKLCDENDILIARYGASLGRICYGLKGAYNVALAKVTPVKSYYREFLRCYLSDSSFYEGINLKGNRAVQAGFNQSDINSFKLLFPSDDQVMQHFELRLSVLFSLRQRIAVENKELVAIRETLLPVLMSDKSLLLD